MDFSFRRLSSISNFRRRLSGAASTHTSHMNLSACSATVTYRYLKKLHATNSIKRWVNVQRACYSQDRDLTETSNCCPRGFGRRCQVLVWLLYRGHGIAAPSNPSSMHQGIGPCFLFLFLRNILTQRFITSLPVNVNCAPRISLTSPSQLGNGLMLA